MGVCGGDPFQVSDPVLGPFAVNTTGPNNEVKQVAHVSDSPSDANATARSGSVTDEMSFTQAMWKEASALPRSPLTIKQSQNKHILRQGIVRQSAKDIKSLSLPRVPRCGASKVTKPFERRSRRSQVASGTYGSVTIAHFGFSGISDCS